MIFVRLVSVLFMCVAICGCSSKSLKQPLHEANSYEYSSIVFNPTHVPSVKVCMDVLSRAFSVVTSDYMCSDTEELNRICFSTLFDMENPKLFEDLYTRSISSGGRVYALIGLYLLDSDKFEVYSNKVNRKEEVLYATRSRSYFPISLGEIINMIRSGKLSGVDVYISAELRPQRVRVLESEINESVQALFGDGRNEETGEKGVRKKGSGRQKGVKKGVRPPNSSY